MFTTYGHIKRNKCCGSGCRHCPFGHSLLKDKSKIQRPAWLVGDAASEQNNKPSIDILFWSGGKDSFLALRALLREKSKQKSEV